LLPGLVRPRNTEKASAVLDEGADSRKTADAADTVAPPPGGHGRNGTQGFVGAQKVEIAHQHLNHGDRRPECGEGNVYGQREPKVLVRIVGQAPLAATVYSLERCVALPVGRHLQRKSWKPSRPSTRYSHPAGSPAARSFRKRQASARVVHWPDPLAFDISRYRALS
jgi:hypothetical protein